ncbi:MAG: MBL fold metallo-hydrolase, partial [Candidatus Limnocylindrales bacterium]
MELIVLGAAPAYTDRRGSAASSYLLRIGGDALLLDLGQGAYPNLASTLDPSTLTALLVSHLHPDHFVDMV